MTTFSHTKGFPVVAVVGLVWLACGAGDWFMRFHRYRWGDTLVWRSPAIIAGPAMPMQQWDIPETRGGDLTGFLALDYVARRFEQTRPAYTDYSDEAGYRNVPPTAGRNFPVIVVGSSYMYVGAPMTNMFSERLAAAAHVPVYNHASQAHGPFQDLLLFFEKGRFADRLPRVLIWGIVEREMRGEDFENMSLQLSDTGKPRKIVNMRSIIAWGNLAPRVVKQTLPNSSVIAQVSARWWNILRYALLGGVAPDVAISQGWPRDGEILFYTPALRAMKQSPSERAVDKVVAVIEKVKEYARERGITLVVLLIPDKEQVYREYLPDYLKNPPGSIPPSCLDEIESGLRSLGAHVVNLLPLFRERAAAGQLIYWRDDTHWNGEASGLAAEACLLEIAPLLAAAPDAPRTGR
ncbi:MAG: hypothetical protein V1929_05315 [bacterium]